MHMFVVCLLKRDAAAERDKMIEDFEMMKLKMKDYEGACGKLFPRHSDTGLGKST